MEINLKVSSSPHILSKNKTSRIMQDVVIALLPATGMALYYFRWNALFLVLTTVVACVLAEYLWVRLVKKRNTLSDFSAVVTGLLLALNLSPVVPLWMAAVGGFFAIIIVKQFFGGIGYNFINPVLGARAFLVASWPVPMTTWVPPLTDTVSSATPLGILKEGGVGLSNLPPIWDMFVGNIGGSLGETSAFALILGGGYLLFRKVISPAIPFSFIGTMAIFTWIFGGDTLFSGQFLYHILAGGLMIGAFFMATDYTTSPTNLKGRIIFGIGCGLLTGIIRVYGGYPGGVSFAILLMNLTVPLIEKGTIPKSFGGVKKHA
jgi:Na+-translocating ferredoxin:NAD+ oxidoreductase subunit D